MIYGETSRKDWDEGQWRMMQYPFYEEDHAAAWARDQKWEADHRESARDYSVAPLPEGLRPQEDARREAAGLPPRTETRRHKGAFALPRPEHTEQYAA